MMFKETNLVNVAIAVLQEHEPKEGYELAFSGGKDSIVIKELALRAEVKFRSIYNVTTADPPELLKFIKKHHPDVEFVLPELTMWQLIPKKLMPPTRKVRYCCQHLKEKYSRGKTVITGIRAAESSRRAKNRKMIELCAPKGSIMINPIFYWEDEETWDFIKKEKLPYCELYDRGFDRLGCIGCPYQHRKGMERDFKIWPTYRKKYIKAFEKMIEMRKGKGYPTTWKTGEDVMSWWLQKGLNLDWKKTSLGSNI